jgi:hypothetical protein
MARYKPDHAGFEEMMNSPAMQSAVHYHAEVLLDLAKEEVPVQSGRLRASGHTEDTPAGSKVVFDAPYAAAVHNGSKARVIRAKGKALHWTDEAGSDHFAKSVKHGPTPPDPYLNRAIDHMREV